jgi:hemolysin activation/secretion protein
VQYILSLYQKKHYAGIYVYVPEGTITEDQELEDGILLINVLEATVSDVTINFFGVDQGDVNDVNDIRKSYLRRSAVEEWSPAKVGQVMNSKSLDYFVNLLNLNPDRHVSAMVSKGTEPNTLALDYNIYETDPWHYFIQVDNSGTNDRQWAPRVGFINTDLLGIDDRFTTVYQAKPDSTIDDNYSIYGNYDFPILGPKLRLNIFGGYSEFDINPEGGAFNFLGRGKFYGASLRYNLLQKKGWFVDIISSYSYEKSKVTPSLFPTAGSDVAMDLFGIGTELRRSDDTSNSSVSFNYTQSIGGSSKRSYQLARTLAEPDFSIYTVAANHNRYLDPNKYHQLRSNVRWIASDERLVPAKMTSFGGMYSVRGYDEYEVVADGGILASIQYEFDWLRYNEAIERNEAQDDPNQAEASTEDSMLTKLSPLIFMDFGRSNIKDPVKTPAIYAEDENVTLWSVGVGAIFEIGKNFNGTCYYGYPLRATDDTRRGKGRLNVSFMMRW